MTLHQAKCRICGRILELKICESYGEAGGDQYKLIPMATCNRCYDLRDTRLSLEERIYRSCNVLKFSEKISSEKMDMIKTALEFLCKKYARMMDDWAGLQVSCYNYEMVNELMNGPDKAFTILKVFRKSVIKSAEQQEYETNS